LPGAGATMRTVVNVRAGGHSPISGALHALVLLALALGLGPVVANVPHAVLAAILMKVGWDTIDRGYLKRMRHAPHDKFVIILVTFGLTVFVDLITAVAVGIILAFFVNSRWLAVEQLKGIKHAAGAEADHLTENERAMLAGANGKVLVTLLHGTFSFASARELARRAAPQLAGLRVVVYDFTHADYIDTSAAIAIQELITLTQSNKQTVMISGLDGLARRTLEGLGALDTVAKQHRFAARHDAIEAAVKLANTDGAADSSR